MGISMVIAMTFGTLNAHTIGLNGYFGTNISDLKSVVLLGVIPLFSLLLLFLYPRAAVTCRYPISATSSGRSGEKVVVLSQLKQLQSQIEPHSCSTPLRPSMLIESDSAKAKRCSKSWLTCCVWPWKTAALRAIDHHTRGRLVVTFAYLNIQKIRLGERLAFSIENTRD